MLPPVIKLDNWLMKIWEIGYKDVTEIYFVIIACEVVYIIVHKMI